MSNNVKTRFAGYKALKAIIPTANLRILYHETFTSTYNTDGTPKSIIHYNNADFAEVLYFEKNNFYTVQFLTGINAGELHFIYANKNTPIDAQIMDYSVNNEILDHCNIYSHKTMVSKYVKEYNGQKAITITGLKQLSNDITYNNRNEAFKLAAKKENTEVYQPE